MAAPLTPERTPQILIALLKAHGIRYVIASPGTTNIALIGSLQQDPFFTLFSAVDERSAAYLACGLAAETGEVVALSCTGATASRNYLSGLTEAFYRKLPILAITSTQAVAAVGHHIAQVIDRSVLPKDVARHAVTLPIVKDADDAWDCEIKVNRALLELRRHGGGPVHINLPTTYRKPFTAGALPAVRVIHRVTPADPHPALTGRVAVFIGAHPPWTAEATAALEDFARVYQAPVFCDHTSGYRGQHRLLFSLAAAQELFALDTLRPTIMIHIGEITGDYGSRAVAGHQVWRVSPDGELRDTFRTLRYVFEMRETDFFRHYAQVPTRASPDYLNQCRDFLAQVRRQVPEVPLSNIWLASRLAHRLPAGATVHFGILNSLRAWNFFELPPKVAAACNVGGFGIDGCLSSLIGASLAHPERLYFGVVGDLAFFYDLNVLGNRHVGPNVRILLVNNGLGAEFTNYNHHAAVLGAGVARFVAAEGHFGRQSPQLVKHYAEDLGFEYLTAASKADVAAQLERFLAPAVTERPMIFEVFTQSGDECAALQGLRRVAVSRKGQVKQLVKRVVGQTRLARLARLVRRARA